MKKLRVPKSTIGFGYVGAWDRGETIGWYLPTHLHRHNKRRMPSVENPSIHQSIRVPCRVFLCRISITPVLDKRGRPRTRVIR